MQTHIITLPQTGYVRQPLLVGDSKTGAPGILPFSASTLWRRVRAGTFPAPLKLSERITAWKAEDVHRWLNEQGHLLVSQGKRVVATPTGRGFAVSEAKS